MKSNSDQKELLFSYISLKIKEKREELKMTQDDLAKLVNLTRTSITNIERGKTQVQLATLLDIASVFNVKLDYFIHIDLLTTSKKNKETDYSPYFNEEINESEEDSISNIIKEI